MLLTLIVLVVLVLILIVLIVVILFVLIILVIMMVIRHWGRRLGDSVLQGWLLRSIIILMLAGLWILVRIDGNRIGINHLSMCKGLVIIIFIHFCSQ